jgi:creatinine deaminase
MDAFLQAAIDEARRGLAEGGIPIGSMVGLRPRLAVEKQVRR